MTCPETMVSQAVENHTHTCVGHVHDKPAPDIADHFCAVCGRWWWSRWQQEEL